MVSELIQDARKIDGLVILSGAGKMTLEEVPVRWREKVREALDD